MSISQSAPGVKPQQAHVKFPRLNRKPRELEFCLTQRSIMRRYCQGDRRSVRGSSPRHKRLRREHPRVSIAGTSRESVPSMNRRRGNPTAVTPRFVCREYKVFRNKFGDLQKCGSKDCSSWLTPYIQHINSKSILLSTLNRRNEMNLARGRNGLQEALRGNFPVHCNRNIRPQPALVEQPSRKTWILRLDIRDDAADGSPGNFQLRATVRHLP